MKSQNKIKISFPVLSYGISQTAAVAITKGFSSFSLDYQAFKKLCKGIFLVAGGERRLCFSSFARENSRQRGWFLTDLYVLVSLLHSEWREAYTVGGKKE